MIRPTFLPLCPRIDHRVGQGIDKELRGRRGVLKTIDPETSRKSKIP